MREVYPAAGTNAAVFRRPPLGLSDFELFRVRAYFIGYAPAKPSMSILAGVIAGFIAWFLVRYLVAGLYTIDQNERAVKTSFGRAERLGTLTTLDDPIAEGLAPEERERYRYPQVRVIPAGGPYFKWPWER